MGGLGCCVGVCASGGFFGGGLLGVFSSFFFYSQWKVLVMEWGFSFVFATLFLVCAGIAVCAASWQLDLSTRLSRENILQSLVLVLHHLFLCRTTFLVTVWLQCTGR